MSEERRHILHDTASQMNVREWQQTLINLVLRILYLVAVPTLVVAVYYLWQDGFVRLVPFYIAAFAFFSVIRFWKKAPYVLQVGTLLAILYAFSILALSRAGLVSSVRIFLIALSFTATIFLGKRAAVASVAISFITMGVAAWIFVTGRASITPEAQLITANAAAWLNYTMTLTLVTVFFVASQNYLLPRLAEALGQSRELTRELEADRLRAEEAAEQRRVHAERMGWVAELGNVLTSLRQRDLLVWRVVREIEQAFSLYQVNLFLMDRTGDVLNLVAATGVQGEALVEEGYRIPVGARLLPGRVAQIGREQTVLPQAGELPHFPQSQVEISFPLSVRGEILGVLDIHSEAPAFSEEVLQLLRIVTGYVTTSLDMLQLFDESDARTEQMRALYAQYTQTSWRTLLEAGQTQSFTAGAATEATTSTLAAEVVTTLEPRSAWLADEQVYLLIVPLVARDVALGSLAFTRSIEKGDWDADSRALIGAAADRLALALDNTRLLVVARQQTLYDEQLSQLSTAIWETPSSEVIMEQSVRELGRFLGASEVQLYLTPGSDETRRGSGTQPLVVRQEPGD